MSLITAHSPRITKSAHTARTAAGLILLPVALLAAAAYGSVALHTVANAVRVAFKAVGFGGSQLSDAPIDGAFAAILGIVVTAIALAVHDRSREQDRDVFDVR